MQSTRALWQHRQPMIRFLGKRTIPKKLDHSPHAHPASPDSSLPESFAQYRNRAIQHGPLGGQQQQAGGKAASSQHAAASLPPPVGSIGGRSAQQLGPIRPGKGEVMDRNELPARFRRSKWTVAEMDAVDSAGASLLG